MAGRFRTSKTGSLKKKHVALIVLMIVMIISVTGFLFVETNLDPALKEIARTYVKQMAISTITDAISYKIQHDMAASDLVLIERDQEENIQLISFDQSRYAGIIEMVTRETNERLMELYKEPVHIPIGQALNSNILAQLGPDVPITLVPMGVARADIDVRLNEAGINTISIEIYLSIEADVRIVIPFSSEEAVVTTEYPIDVMVLPGDVPQYYFKGGDGSVTPLPHVAVPGPDEE